MLTSAEVTLEAQQKDVEQNLKNPQAKVPKGKNPFDDAKLLSLNKKIDQDFIKVKELQAKLVHVQEFIDQKQ